MTVVRNIPGAEELLGKGVYQGMPKEVPRPVRDRQAVVAGEPAACAAAARLLGEAGWRVTVVKPDTELVCAAGIEYLEALVLRRVGTGRIDAVNASALFMFSHTAA